MTTARAKGYRDASEGAAQEAVEYVISHVSPANFGGYYASIFSRTKMAPGTKLYTSPAAAGIDLHAPCTEAVYALARKLLWIAYVWNDHNFDHPYKIAKELAQEFGIGTLEQANAWLDEQAKLIDASPKGGSDAQDAARYRWLRDRKFSFSHDEESRGIAISRWGEWPYDTGEGHAAVMDAAIDAAIQATSAEVGA